MSIQNPVRLRVLRGTKSLDETLCPLGQPEKAIGQESRIEPWLALHNQSACLRQRSTVSLPQHDESAETAKSQSLVTLLGLDDNTLSSRSEAIFIDIPFYRTGFSEAALDLSAAAAAAG